MGNTLLNPQHNSAQNGNKEGQRGVGRQKLA